MLRSLAREPYAKSENFRAAGEWDTKRCVCACCNDTEGFVAHPVSFLFRWGEFALDQGMEHRALPQAIG